jgi:hypothetical protein
MDVRAMAVESVAEEAADGGAVVLLLLLHRSGRLFCHMPWRQVEEPVLRTLRRWWELSDPCLHGSY